MANNNPILDTGTLTPLSFAGLAPGQYLGWDGTAWTNVAGGTGSGTVTSVGLTTSLSGLIITNSPITTFGDIDISGTLGISAGGTGANIRNVAINNLLPDQTGMDTMVLTTDGTNVSWGAGGGGGSGIPGGSTGQIQYNNTGAFGGFTMSGDATLNAFSGVITVATSTNIRGGLALEVPVQSGADTTTFVPAPTVTGDVLTYDGATIAWTTPTAATTIVPDTTTASPVYPAFVETTSGALTTVNINDVSLQYTPSTGLFASSVFQATEGFFQNPNVIPASFTVPATTNQMSVGPVTLGTGVVVTVPPSSVWKVI